MPERPQLRVAMAITEEERWRVLRFRYTALVEEQKVESRAADHDNRVIHDFLDDDAVIFYLTEKTEIIATARLAPLAQMRFPAWQQEAFGFERFGPFPARTQAYVSRFAATRAWRGSPALAVLFGAIYKFARERALRFVFLHCAPAQLRLFERLGYRRHGANFRAEAGYRVPLVMVLEDLRHLEAVASPLARLALRFENDPETANWFARTFPDGAGAAPGPGPNATEEDFWIYLTRRLDQLPTVGVPLFDGLSPAEAKKFLSVGTVLRCRDADPVIRAGDVGDEMFVLLSGSAEVLGDDPARPLARLEKGDIFGELGFLRAAPRTANVLARADLEVLVLSQDFFRKVMETMPEITIKVLFNLAVILCARLTTTTESLLGAGEADAPAAGEEAGARAGALG